MKDQLNIMKGTTKKVSGGGMNGGRNHQGDLKSCRSARLLKKTISSKPNRCRRKTRQQICEGGECSEAAFCPLPEPSIRWSQKTSSRRKTVEHPPSSGQQSPAPRVAPESSHSLWPGAVTSDAGSGTVKTLCLNRAAEKEEEAPVFTGCDLTGQDS